MKKLPPLAPPYTERKKLLQCYMQRVLPLEKGEAEGGDPKSIRFDFKEQRIEYRQDYQGNHRTDKQSAHDRHG